MKFLVALAVLTVVGAHATSDIVVKVEEEELSPLLRWIVFEVPLMWTKDKTLILLSELSAVEMCSSVVLA